MKEPKATGLPVEFIPPLHASQDLQSSGFAPGAASSRLCAWLVCADETVSRLVQERLAALEVTCTKLPALDHLAGVPPPSPALAVVEAPASVRRLREMCVALRGGPGGAEVLILGLLPDGSPRAQCEALEAGCDEVLPRPPDARLLGLRLALLLRQARQRLALRQAAHDLCEGQAPLQAILDAIPREVFVKDAQGRILMANRRTAQTVGRPAAEFIGQRSFDAHATPEAIARITESDRLVLAHGQTYDQVQVRTIPDGSRTPFRVVKAPWRNERGEIVGLVGMAEDISERLQAEERLLQSQTLLHAVFDTIPHDIFVKDRQGRYLMVNRSMARRWERAPEDFVGKTSPPGLPDEEAAERVHTDRQVIERGEPVSGVSQRTHPNGERRSLHIIKAPLRDGKGDIVGLVGMAEDVTERIQAERDLHSSRALLQAVLDAIPHAVFVKDREDRYVTVNKATEALQPPEAGPLIGRRLLGEGGRPRPEQELSASSTRRILEGAERVDFNQVVTLGEREPRIFHTVKVPLRDDRGAVTGVVGVAEDITEFVQAERKLRDSRALLQAVFDTIPHDVFVKDRQGRFMMLNRSALQRWDRPIEDFIGQAVSGIGSYPEETAQIEEADRKLIRDGAPYSGVMLRTMRDGSRHPFHIIKTPLRDEKGEIVGLVGLAEDITERVQAERDLRDSRALLKAVFDAIPHAVYAKNAESRFIAVNKAMEDLLQIPAAELLTQRFGNDDARTPEDREMILRQDRRVIESGERVDEVQRVSLPGLGQREFRFVKVPLLNQEGKVAGLAGLAEDITERVQADAALQENRRLLQTILDTLPEAVFVKDRQGRYVLFNEECVRRLERPRELLIGQSLQDLSGFTPDAMNRLLEADRKVLETGEITELPQEQRQYADGRVIWERRLKAPLRDAGGAIVGIVGIAEDITDRVRAEQALKANELLLRKIIDSLPDALSVKDHNARYLLVNAKQAGMYGLAPERFVGFTFRELLGQTLGERAAMIADSDRRVLENGEMVEIPEVRFQPAGGGEKWERIAKVPLRDEAGKVIGLIGILEDITARKKAEAERLELERLVQRTQNLESLGAMAGGIAHDFNNLLQRILGYTELAVLEAGPESPALQSLQTVQEAGASAVALTRQMLTLSGGSGFTLEPVDLNGLARTTVPEMEKLVAPKLTLTVRGGADAPVVMADAPLLRQVLLSLVSNASEALAAAPAGEITVATGTHTLEREKLDDTFSERDLASGVYGYLEVRDTGPGLAEGVRRRLYEPFYSTKFIGRGLGLAAVRGIVRGHQGAIQALSAPNEGATFRIYLPAAGPGEVRAAALSAPE